MMTAQLMIQFQTVSTVKNKVLPNMIHSTDIDLVKGYPEYRGRVFKENILTSDDRVQKFYRACVNLTVVERIKDEEQMLPY